MATFKYNSELEPNGPLTALDPLASGNYWALVTLAEVNDLQPNGQFIMKTEIFFDKMATPDVALAWLVLNLKDYVDGDFPVLFEVQGCTPGKLTSTIYDSFSPPIDPLKPSSMVAGPLNPNNPNSPQSNGVGVDGAGQLGNGFVVLLTLPEANPELNNGQSPITLLVNGPSGDFSVASFLGSCSNDGFCATIDGCQNKIVSRLPPKCSLCLGSLPAL